MNAKRKARKTRGFIIVLILIVFLILSAIIALRLYKGIFYSNVRIPDSEKNEVELFIPTASTFEEVLNIINEADILKSEINFRLLAEKMNYPAHVHAGRYIIKRGMSNYDLIRKLRSGESDPMMVEIDKVSSVEELASKVGKVLEIDSHQIAERIYSKEFLQKHGLNKNNALVFFIPDSYEFYWNVSIDGFFTRMKKEYDKFWKDEKIALSKKIGLDPVRVNILASIVQEEASISDEMPRIAGVYINRIKKGMRLQADPTVKFIIRHRSNPKLYLADYKIESPYNTYIYAGLPPGPIIITRKEALDAVLNYERHTYLYFVVKHDGSGRHVFSENYEQHKYYRNLWLKSKKNR